jgi:hypothetical protein
MAAERERYSYQEVERITREVEKWVDRKVYAVFQGRVLKGIGEIGTLCDRIGDNVELKNAMTQYHDVEGRWIIVPGVTFSGITQAIECDVAQFRIFAESFDISFDYIWGKK